MTNRRARIVAGASVVGLAALGGVALDSNPGMPTATPVASNRSSVPIVTAASGAATLPTTPNGAAARPPIITRASGGVALPLSEED